MECYCTITATLAVVVLVVKTVLFRIDFLANHRCLLLLCLSIAMNAPSVFINFLESYFSLVREYSQLFTRADTDVDAEWCLIMRRGVYVERKRMLRIRETEVTKRRVHHKTVPCVLPCISTYTRS